jgi:hypothetical protein
MKKLIKAREEEFNNKYHTHGRTTWPIDEENSPYYPEPYDIKSFIKETIELVIKEVIKEIENIKHSHTNYTTQMSSKKNFDRGNIAKEITEEIIDKLKNSK